LLANSATESQADKELETAPDSWRSDQSHQDLSELLHFIAKQEYRFVSVTPATHERYLSRGIAVGNLLRDIFGWNLPFKKDLLPPPLRHLMSQAGALAPCGEYVKSNVRIASVGDDVFLHSAFPTTASDAVFLGPDTYRFVRLIRHNFPAISRAGEPLRILDIGCGSGAGGMAAVRALEPGHPYTLTMNDINPLALEYTLVNAQTANMTINILPGDVFETLEGQFDLILSNPPYMNDVSGRIYRDGGSRLGLDLSVRITQHAIEHLAPGGRLILYTGVAMTDQSDPFLSELLPILTEMDCHWSYEEIDPDIFGEELAQPGYESVCRIAAVGLIVDRRN